MTNKSQKLRLGEVRRCTEYLEELAQKINLNEQLSPNHIESVRAILDNLRRSVHGRLGRKERELVRAAQGLINIVEESPQRGTMAESEQRAWAHATTTWKVITEEMSPIDRKALRDIILYHDDNSG